MAVIIETSIGQLTVDLYTEERPRCSENFLKLCKVKYYNFSLFHSVQENLVAQTGDPTATGRGGMSVYGMVYGEQARYFDMEVSPRIKHKKRGLLSMVNNGAGKHGSQFFITLGESLDYLDGEHTVFGEVAEGFEVLDKLNEAYCDEKHRPYRDIRIFHTVILDDPYDDPQGLEIPDKSPGPTQEMLQSDRIGVDEEVDDTKGLTEEEIKELQEEREAKANAQLLEMVGDLPDADTKPPDNVLFVCKLNPVTTDEDLEMIFSRFGPITSCEVICDHKTKESLQYAFVEFEKPEHCENAYFKMDNVLIDDRRIHVDFSQSVSKIRPMDGQNKGEEEKKDEDRPKYVLKDQQRRDTNYDLVFEHDDLGEDKERKKKKNKTRRQSQSDEDRDSKKQKAKKQRDSQSRSKSPVQQDKTRPPALSSHHHRNNDRNNDHRNNRKTSSSSENEDRRNEKTANRRKSPSVERQREKKKERRRSPSEEYRRERKRSPEEDRKKEKKKDRRRSPSSEEDERRNRRRLPSEENRQKDRKKERRRPPSPVEDRRKQKKERKKSPSSEADRRKKKKDRRSPSFEEDRRKERKRSPSSEEDRKKDKKKRRKRSSSEEDRRKEIKRSPSEEDRKKEKKKDRKRSPSQEEIRRKDKMKERKRSPSSEEDRRKKKARKLSASPDRESKRKEKKRDRRQSSLSSSEEEEEGRRNGRKKESRQRRDRSVSPRRDRDRRR